MLGTNPYLNRQPINHPNEFFGRTQDVRWLLERILHPVVPQCCSITGLRRIGKTSLLRFLEHEEGAKRLYPDYFRLTDKLLLVYVDLSRDSLGVDKDNEALTLATLRHILRSLARNARKQVNKEIATEIAAQRRAGGNTWQGVLEALDECLLLLSENRFRVIFMLDEMDVATAWHPRLAQALRALVMEYNVAYITASLKPLFELLEEGRTSPFYNLFSTHPLGLLEQKDARTLLTEPAREQGLTWSRKLSEQLLEATGGHPDLVKRAGSHLWDLFKIKGCQPEINTVLQALTPDAYALFTSMWDHLSDKERSVVAKIAVGQQTHATDVSTILPALQHCAILLDSTQGTELFGQLFHHWVKEQGPENHIQNEPRLEGRWLCLNKRKIQLTPTEVKLTRALLHRRGETVSREELQDAVWKNGLSNDSKALDTSIQRLRGKIELDRNNPKWLITVRGEGYLFR